MKFVISIIYASLFTFLFYGHAKSMPKTTISLSSGLPVTPLPSLMIQTLCLLSFDGITALSIVFLCTYSEKKLVCKNDFNKPISLSFLLLIILRPSTNDSTHKHGGNDPVPRIYKNILPTSSFKKCVSS